MKREYLEARDLAMKNADALVKKSEDGGSPLTNEEMETLRGYHTEIDNLDKKIELLDKQEKLRAASAIPAVHNVPAQTKEERKIVERYSLRKALVASLPGEAPTGLYKEMHEEAIREMRDCEVKPAPGGVNVPSMLLRESSHVQKIEHRDNEVTDPTKGGYTVQTDIEEVVSILRPEIALREAGATFMTGLQGNVAFPPQDAGAVATWKGETEESGEGIITFANNEMTPHRLPTYTDYSLQLLYQSSIDIDAFIRNDLQGAIGQAVEKAAYNGDGVGAEPLGLLNQVGLAVHAVGDPDGGVAGWNDIVALETLVAAANADRGNLAYVTNSQVRGALKVNRTDPGSGLMTWNPVQGPGLLNGRPAYVSNNVPSDLTKGLGTDLSAIMYGNWADLIVGNWGGMNIVTDPYSKATSGQVRITINTFWDILFRRLSSFAAIVDADTSTVAP